MHRTPFYPPPQAPSPPSPQAQPSRPNKVILQREYREKEGECINMLRDIIRNLTGDELRTRQEILRKAIEILSTAPELKGGVRGDGSTASDAHLSWQTHPPDMASMTSTQAVADPTQLPPNHSQQNWMSNTERDGTILYHGAHAQDQQYESLDAIATLLRQASSQGYDEDWFDHPPV